MTGPPPADTAASCSGRRGPSRARSRTRWRRRAARYGSEAVSSSPLARGSDRCATQSRPREPHAADGRGSGRSAPGTTSPRCRRCVRRSSAPRPAGPTRIRVTSPGGRDGHPSPSRRSARCSSCGMSAARSSGSPHAMPRTACSRCSSRRHTRKRRMRSRSRTRRGRGAPAAARPNAGPSSKTIPRCRGGMSDGYRPTDEGYLNLVRPLDDIDGNGAGDDRVRPVDDDVEGRASITHAAFGSDRPFADYAADYAAFRASPAYPQGWDLVLHDDDGRAAACCIAWIDPVSRAGTFEPVATHPVPRSRVRQGTPHRRAPTVRRGGHDVRDRRGRRRQHARRGPLSLRRIPTGPYAPGVRARLSAAGRVRYPSRHA